MSELRELIMDVCASLWIIPADIKELSNRLDKSEYGLSHIVSLGIEKGWIYRKGKRFHTYKKTVKNVLNKNGYELDPKEPYKSPFRKEFEKSIR